MDDSRVEPYDNVTETNENFDCVLFPEKEEKIELKQGITIKGSSEEYIEALKAWKDILENNDSRDRAFIDIRFKCGSFKKEKDGTKCTVSITKKNKVAKCILTIFKSGTILVIRTRPSDIIAVLDFSSEVLIPILKGMIAGQMGPKALEYLVADKVQSDSCVHVEKLFTARMN